MATKERWETAQSYEKSYWDRRADKMAREESDSLAWYGWRAERLAERIAKAYGQDAADFSTGSVLEVGSGPVGIISFITAADRHAIDPLADFYASREELVRDRDAAVNYVNGPAEKLPFEDASFDLVIIDNVIDHVQEADQVMREIHRVLKPGAILYFAVNVRQQWGYMLHRVLSDLQIDKGHPHSFNLRRAHAFVERHGFPIQHEEWEDYAKCRAKEWASPARKDKIKAALGLTEFVYTAIARRA